MMTARRSKPPPQDYLLRVARLYAAKASSLDAPPCDTCWQRAECATTGYECELFRRYVGSKK